MSGLTRTMISSTTAELIIAVTERSTRVRPRRRTKALGTAAPRRVPRPAAAMRAMTRTAGSPGLALVVEREVVEVHVDVVAVRGVLRVRLDVLVHLGQELVGLVLVDRVGQRELTDENMKGL